LTSSLLSSLSAAAVEVDADSETALLSVLLAGGMDACLVVELCALLSLLAAALVDLATPSVL